MTKPPRTRPGRAAFLPLVLAVSLACGPGTGEKAPERSSPGEGPEAGAAVPVETPAAPGSMAPELALVDDGGGAAAALTWLEPVPVPEPERSADEIPADEEEVTEKVDPRRWRVRFARLAPSGAGWSEPVTVAGRNGPGGVAERGFFANWADRPGLVQGGSSGPGGPLFAHWLARNGDSVYAYEVGMARSDDGGATWRPLGRLHEDAAATEHGFVSYAADPAAPDGVRAFWLDGRRMPDGGPMTLRTALVGEEVDRDSEELLDPSVCECCATAAVATSGGPLAVYRGRTEEEMRDHRLVRRSASAPEPGESASGGWSEPELLHRDGWQIAACPVNGPAAGRLGDTVWVAWFTAAPEDDGGQPTPRVLAAVSGDGGATFGDPISIAAPGEGEAPLGRLDLAVADGSAIVSWLESTPEGAVIRLRRISADGRAGAPVAAARSAGSRASGVPRLLALPGGGSGGDGSRLLIAWVDPGEEGAERSIRLAELPASRVPPPGDA